MVLRTTLATTWPVRKATPPMFMDRNRSTMPSVMSVQTRTAVSAEPKPAQSTSTPGTT